MAFPQTSSSMPLPPIKITPITEELMSPISPTIPKSVSSSTTVFINNALETINTSREGRRKGKLKDSLVKAIDFAHVELTIKKYNTFEKTNDSSDACIIFEPLQLACQTRTTSLMITALDCIGKLISYNYLIERPVPWSPDLGNEKEPGTTTRVIKQPLSERIVDTICECFVGEYTDDKVQLQIIKALLAAVSSTTVPIHQSSLLKSIRTAYNIFLLSRNPNNQIVAQGILTQMVHHVFARVKIHEKNKSFRSDTTERQDMSNNNINDSNSISNGGGSGGINNDGMTIITAESEMDLGMLMTLNDGEEMGKEHENNNINGNNDDSEITRKFSSDVTTTPTVEPDNPLNKELGQLKAASDSREEIVKAVAEEMEESKGGSGESSVEEKLTLQSFENRKSFEGASEFSSINDTSTNKPNLYVKDAFLVFRALCKLSMKPLSSETSMDLKSHSMRSKLLSLHLMLTILSSHMPVFASPEVIITSSTTFESTPLIQAVKQYLCLSLSRNAVSPVQQVFEISLEIFWKCLSRLRSHLKKEIEVFFNEIFLPILEMRNSSTQQKYALLNILLRICNDPQGLVEIYLNYDCEREALDNIYERIVNIVSKITTSYSTGIISSSSASTIPSFDPNKEKDRESNLSSSSSTANTSNKNTGSSSPIVIIPPSLTTTTVEKTKPPQSPSHIQAELVLKIQGLECLVSVLRSLVVWCSNKSDEDGDATSKPSPTSSIVSLGSQSANKNEKITSAWKAMDDPEQFENLKHRKQILQDGIKTFNFKPKRGILALLSADFITSTAPIDIARFLLTSEGLNKAMIGEYLGEGEQENIAIMHAFVDLMDFNQMKFVDALRLFLQSFRLPGEAQKIDRFMLKFAERYVDGNPNQFANADTAYVLAYSVIMLNTDLHNPQIKRRMTKPQFIQNNRGINDNSDLPEEYLEAIYDEILNNEIKLKDEQEAAVMQHAVPSPSGGIGISTIGNAIVNAGRDFKREAYQVASEEMANKTENLFKSMLRAQRRGIYTANTTFYSASHFEHVRPMFEVAWMPVLAGLSGPLQITEDPHIVTLALEGFKLAIRIICLFDLELERNAFVTTLSKFTFLNNLGEMKPKNVEAIKSLLDIALTEGNYLKNSWREVLICVSQLERFQLISNGVDQTVVPDLFNARKQNRKSSTESSVSRRTSFSKRPFSSKSISQVVFAEDVAMQSRSSEVVVAVDKIFSSSSNLSGTAIVEFVRALCEVSWEEIQSSSMTEHPRIFSLQKLVEISYYNMGRIRMEWSKVWAILGEHFNQVGCHPNVRVGFFAIDSLRQLSMQFLAKEELPHFKFQKDFLKPFAYILANNPKIELKDMALRCLQQMIQARAQNIKSGWKTMFSVFSSAAKEPHESIVVMAFDLVKGLFKNHFEVVVANSTYPDLMVCLCEFCKNDRFQKTSLQAIELIDQSISKMLEYPKYQINGQIIGTNEDPSFKFWYPALFGFHDIIMNGDDLEVRTRALQYMFDTLKKYGSKYSEEFWDVICRQVLFPIFGVLRSNGEDLLKVDSPEDMSVWLSTTMIQALPKVIEFQSFYNAVAFVVLIQDGMIDLKKENKALSRIGSSCLQQLIENNVTNLDFVHWGKISQAFIRLFEMSTPYNLLDEDNHFLESAHELVDEEEMNEDQENEDLIINIDSVRKEISSWNNDNEVDEYSSPTKKRTSQIRQRHFEEFDNIKVKCILHLLVIENINELLKIEIIYKLMPVEHLLILAGCLEKSHEFALKFDENYELRLALWKLGFMKRLPNLLKQESISATSYINLTLRMLRDPNEDRQQKKQEIEKKLIPLTLSILRRYNSFDRKTQAPYVTAWTPVIAIVLHCYLSFSDEDFLRYINNIYPVALDLLLHELGKDVRPLLQELFIRTGVLYKITNTTSTLTTSTFNTVISNRKTSINITTSNINPPS
ncbi:12392_t:CDS:10 [Ambispora gerdemannii]|uniref:12392_t:CDS:1 n=1 Tax=Ambispora gerdemannii TaxID=144530 RepID=A0A9N8VH56_9GLOM|nr:12392_t:CDS:10 [Ambispora gerdemannii]